MRKPTSDDAFLYAVLGGIGTVAGFTAWLLSVPWWAIALSAIIPPVFVLYIILALMALPIRNI
jgi:phage shock protein PspC (stress-responsive transcriptional regulator)